MERVYSYNPGARTGVSLERQHYSSPVPRPQQKNDGTDKTFLTKQPEFKQNLLRCLTSDGLARLLYHQDDISCLQTLLHCQDRYV